MWAVERGLQLAAEIVLDVGNHILSAHFGVSAQDYEDIITQLGGCGVIDPGLQERLRGLGGFRIVLVHGYLRMDPQRVAESLAAGPGSLCGLRERRAGMAGDAEVVSPGSPWPGMARRPA